MNEGDNLERIFKVVDTGIMGERKAPPLTPAEERDMVKHLAKMPPPESAKVAPKVDEPKKLPGS